MIKRLFGFSEFSAPLGIRILTIATAVRWMGWGFAEALLPVFIFSFSRSYAEAGLIRAAYDVSFILALPVIGMAADRFKATSIILTGLLLYTLIGASYFLAGVTGMVFFVVLGRFLNGVTFAMDSVGRGTYFRRNASDGKLATIFGYFDTIANFWWVVAALLGMWLIQYFSISQLLFLITPTSLIAFFIIWYFQKTPEVFTQSKETENLNQAYGLALKELIRWDWKLKSVAMFNFFIALISSVLFFFLPIQAYTEGAGLSKTILIGVMFALPYIFGWWLGKWFDNQGIKTFAYGLIAMALLVISLVFLDMFWWQALVAFCVGLILELISVGNNELITACAQPEHFGRVGSIMTLIYDIGALVGPLVVGVMIDSRGIRFAYISMSALMIVLVVIAYLLKSKLDFSKIGSVSLSHKKMHRHI